jgi:hypothetical protein
VGLVRTRVLVVLRTATADAQPHPEAVPENGKLLSGVGLGVFTRNFIFVSQ